MDIQIKQLFYGINFVFVMFTLTHKYKKKRSKITEKKLETSFSPLCIKESFCSYGNWKRFYPTCMNMNMNIVFIHYLASRKHFSGYSQSFRHVILNDYRNLTTFISFVSILVLNEIAVHLYLLCIKFNYG